MKPKLLFTAFFLLPVIIFAQKNWTPEQCLKIKNITAVQVSPDGSKVLYTVREAVMTDDRCEYVNQVWLCNADGNNHIQLTKGDRNSSNPKWSPDGKTIAFTSSRDNKTNLYLLPVAGGEAEKVTDVKTGVGNYNWGPDGSVIAFTMADAADDKEEKNKKAKNDWYFMDLMAGVDEVIKKGIADEIKMGVMGWSYGGFMSSWIVGHTDRFKAASIGAPVVDLSHQNLTDDIEGFLPSYFQGNPWDDWAKYDAHSPLRFVQNVKTPVMLQHGEADQRVPFSNAVMFYNALRRRGVPVRLLALPRQPHGPQEPRMVLKTMQTNVEWFEKFIGDKKGF
jgi:dipeptidyl aminopeptidase/acylaminoacyl peptidase